MIYAANASGKRLSLQPSAPGAFRKERLARLSARQEKVRARNSVEIQNCLVDPNTKFTDQTKRFKLIPGEFRIPNPFVTDMTQQWNAEIEKRTPVTISAKFARMHGFKL